MPTQLASASPCTIAPALDPDQGWREPLQALADRCSPRLARWRTFRTGGQVIPSFVLVGPRGQGMPIRLALIAGLSAQDAVATAALAKLLVELDLAPLLAQDYALFSYPQANPTPRAASAGRNFTKDFWRGSADPAVRFFEREFEVNAFDAIIFIQANQPVCGFQIRTCNRLIATEVLWAAVEVAQRFVPLAPEPIRLWPSFDAEQTSIFNTGHLRPRPFCLSLCTPGQRSGEEQIAAIVFGLKQILRHYRALIRHTQRL